MHSLSIIKRLNSAGPRVVERETLKKYVDEYIGIEFEEVEWVDESKNETWVDYTVYFTAECGNLSIFSFRCKIKAEQLFSLMKEGY